MASAATQGLDHPALSRLTAVRRLTLLALVVVNLSALALGALSILNDREANIAVARTETANLATAVTRDMDGLVARIDLVLLSARDALQAQLAVDRHGIESIDAVLARLAERIPEAVALRFADATGRIVHGSDADPNINIADREHFIGARAANPTALIVGKPVLSRLGQQWVLPVALRVSRKDGAFAGIVYVLVALERLAEGFSRLDVGRHGGVALRDAEMGLVLRVPELEGVGARIGDRSVSQTVKNLIATGATSATYTATTPADKRTRTASLRRVGSVPLYVIVTLAEDEYLAAWRTQTAQTAALILTLVALSLILGWMVRRSWQSGMATIDALAASQQLFQTVTEHASDWVYWRNAAGNAFHYMSPICETITGYGPAAFAADPGLLDRIIHPDDRARWDAHLHEVSTGQPHAGEDYRIVTRTGEIRWLRHSCRAVTAPDGTEFGRRGTNQDITAQKRTDARLERQLASLKTLNEIASLRSTTCDEALHQALGVGARFLALEFGIVSQVRDDSYTVVAQVSPPATLRDGQTFPLGTTYCSMTLAQGEVVAIHDMGHSPQCGHPCYAAFKLEAYIGAPLVVDGAVYGTVNFSSPHPYHRAFDAGDREFVALMARWIGAAIERDAARRQLADSERRMRALLDASSESTLLLDPQGKLLAINLLGAQRFGKTPAQMVGLNFFDLLPADLAASRRALLSRVAESGEPLRARDQRGLIHFENNIYPVLNDAGTVESIAVYAQDITEQHRSGQIDALFHQLDMMLLKWQMNVPTIAQIFCDGLLPLFDLAVAWVGRAEKSGALSLVAIAEQGDGPAGFAAAVRRQCRRWRDGEGFCAPAGLAVSEGRTLKIGFAGDDCTACRAAADAAGIAAGMLMPLTLRGGTWGVLALYARHDRLFDEPKIPPQLAAIASRFAALLEASLQQEWLALLDTALATTSNAVFITDATSRILWVNRAFVALSGYAAEELVGATPRLFNAGVQDAEFYRRFWAAIQSGATWQGEIVNARRGGEHYTVHQTVTPLRDALGEIGHYVSILEDISERKAAEARIERMANFDMLTELPNRNLFFDRLGQALARARRDAGLGALLYLDLDRFKAVNDELGHEAGDRLLRAVAERCRAAVRDSDTVARLAGDEFAVLLPHIVEPDDAARVAGKIVDALALPFDLAGREARIGASIGIALYPPHGDTVEALLNAADDAMYETKRAGRNGYRFPAGNAAPANPAHRPVAEGMAAVPPPADQR